MEEQPFFRQKTKTFFERNGINPMIPTKETAKDISPIQVPAKPSSTDIEDLQQLHREAFKKASEQMGTFEELHRKNDRFDIIEPPMAEPAKQKFEKYPIESDFVAFSTSDVLNIFFVNYKSMFGEDMFADFEKQVEQSNKINSFVGAALLRGELLNRENILSCVNSIGKFIITKPHTECLIGLLIFEMWYSRLDEFEKMYRPALFKQVVIDIIHRTNSEHVLYRK